MLKIIEIPNRAVATIQFGNNIKAQYKIFEMLAKDVDEIDKGLIDDKTLIARCSNLGDEVEILTVNQQKAIINQIIKLTFGEQTQEGDEKKS